MHPCLVGVTCNHPRRVFQSGRRQDFLCETNLGRAGGDPVKGVSHRREKRLVGQSLPFVGAKKGDSG